MRTRLKISQYRSGIRFVVIEEQIDTAGAEVVFGPATRDECIAYVAEQEAGIVPPPAYTVRWNVRGKRHTYVFSHERGFAKAAHSRDAWKDSNAWNGQEPDDLFVWVEDHYGNVAYGAKP